MVWTAVAWAAVAAWGPAADRSLGAAPGPVVCFAGAWTAVAGGVAVDLLVGMPLSVGPDLAACSAVAVFPVPGHRDVAALRGHHRPAFAAVVVPSGGGHSSPAIAGLSGLPHPRKKAPPLWVYR